MNLMKREEFNSLRVLYIENTLFNISELNNKLCMLNVNTDKYIETFIASIERECKSLSVRQMIKEEVKKAVRADFKISVDVAIKNNIYKAMSFKCSVVTGIKKYAEGGCSIEQLIAFINSTDIGAVEAKFGLKNEVIDIETRLGFEQFLICDYIELIGIQSTIQRSIKMLDEINSLSQKCIKDKYNLDVSLNKIGSKYTDATVIRSNDRNNLDTEINNIAGMYTNAAIICNKKIKI